MKRQLKSFDFFLLAAVCLLVIFGIIMIGSATQKNMTNESTRQILWFAMGLVLLFIATFIDYHFICRFYVPIYLLCITLLVAVLVYNWSVGERVARWFAVGTADFNFKIQPSEFTKIFMIIFLSTFISKRKEDINRPVTLLISLGLIALPVLLIMMQPSLSASIVVLFLSGVILFAGNLSMKYLIGAGVLVIPTCLLLYKDLLSQSPILVNRIFGEYQVGRLVTFFSPEKDSDAMFQTDRSIQAIGSGQFSGKGLYNGLITQFSNLPEAHNDFIFSVIGEEWGFVGCIIVLSVILFVIVKCLHTGQNSADFLGRMICAGVAAMIAFQVFVNVGVATGMLPNTGMPFPFVSYGGSSLWINMTCIGLVINVGMTKHKSFFEG